MTLGRSAMEAMPRERAYDVRHAGEGLPEASNSWWSPMSTKAGYRVTGPRQLPGSFEARGRSRHHGFDAFPLGSNTCTVSTVPLRAILAFGKKHGACKSHRAERMPSTVAGPAAQGSLAPAPLFLDPCIGPDTATKPDPTMPRGPPFRIRSPCMLCAAFSVRLRIRRYSVARLAPFWEQGKVGNAKATIGAPQPRRDGVKETQPLTRACGMERDWDIYMYFPPKALFLSLDVGDLAT
ncbi:hypothetical protein MAPG_03458 [Magnaporthiopsis poae ATCC 64411]|uniref:Uncharacterized protein n=1 Tax=Magnaporthiopsis poae (strain ATCC 64411 / 73-15) TaxID=644358 RepID=A0A0C4DU24_MAGP6|nr:hypothetical protein MAPG_03458 [Magnaporthiopsis poae ATCC 64411]